MSMATLTLRNLVILQLFEPFVFVEMNVPMKLPIFSAFSFIILSRGKLWACTQNSEVEKSISSKLVDGSHCFKMMWAPLTDQGLPLMMHLWSSSFLNEHDKVLLSSTQMSGSVKFQVDKSLTLTILGFMCLSDKTRARGVVLLRCMLLLSIGEKSNISGSKSKSVIFKCMQ